MLYLLSTSSRLSSSSWPEELLCLPTSIPPRPVLFLLFFLPESFFRNSYSFPSPCLMNSVQMLVTRRSFLDIHRQVAAWSLYRRRHVHPAVTTPTTWLCVHAWLFCCVGHPATHVHLPHPHQQISNTTSGNWYWLNKRRHQSSKDLRTRRGINTGPLASKSCVIQSYQCGVCQMDCYPLVPTQKVHAGLCMWRVAPSYQQGRHYEWLFQQWLVTDWLRSVHSPAPCSAFLVICNFNH